MGRVWDELIPESDRLIYQRAGYGNPVELGKRPAVLIIDVTLNFTGDRPEPILDSISRFSNSCGPAAWTAMDSIAQLLSVARADGVPVFYTRGPLRKTPLTLGGWGRTNTRMQPVADAADPGEQFPAPIAPEAGDQVLEKLKPSAFFGTPFIAMLTELGIDTLLVCGTSTSGCVRASVIDAFSYGLRVGVVEEGVFDRGTVSHAINLFDMNQKYATVFPLAEALAYLGRVRAARPSGSAG